MRTASFRPVLVALVALALAACGDSSSSDESSRRGERGGERSATTPAVEAIEARFGSLPLEERLSGTVRADNQVAIYPEIDAPIAEVIAQNGDFVEAGDPLVRLRPEGYRDRLQQAEASLRIARAEAKQAEANLEELRSQLERTERLAEKQYQSQQELESVRAQAAAAEASYERAQGQVQQAQATLQERRAELNRTVVRAPISGRVGQRSAEVGMRVDGSTRLYTIGDFDNVQIEAAVGDRVFGQINTGQTVRITSESLPDTIITAEVSRISPFLSSESFSAEIEVDVPNPGGVLRPGMFVAVDVAYGESQQATLVPKSALYEDPRTGVQGVFVAPTLGTEIPAPNPEEYGEDERPPLTEATPTEFKEVDVLAEGRQLAGIRGVEPGTWVVTVGQNLLSTSGSDRIDARVRPMAWERILSLQTLQDQDLLQRFMERQQRIAEEQFGTPDTSAQSEAADPPVAQDTSSGPTSSVVQSSF